MFGATASDLNEVASASNKQTNAGRGKYTRHDGVDYLVEWEEEYEGQWGKHKKQWVRDIDIRTPQIIEQYEKSKSDKHNSPPLIDDKDDKYEDDARAEEAEEYKENEINHKHDNNKEEKIKEDDDEEIEEIRAFLGQIENEKLTDRSIRDRKDYDKFVR